MRFFGIFAALTAVASVFAAPVAVPAPNAELAAKRAEIAVPVKISKLALALKVNTDGLIPQIQQIISDPTGAVEDNTELVKALLGQVVICLKDTLTGLSTDPAGTVKDLANDVVGTVDGTVESLTPQQLKDLLQGIVDKLTPLLQAVLSKIGSNPEIAGLVQTVFFLLKSIFTVVAGVVPIVSSLLGGLKSITGLLGLSKLGLPLN
ncbi:hypothetical protein CPB86DRAFT_308841 [Serendipita vermifera]|nr:hypothetical protein CPB86DRAFT_308841 [Serendipita vermifera]